MADPDLAAFHGTRCLVTGGLGFIGSNLALTLHRAGAKVTVVDSLVPRHGGNRRNLDGAPIEVVVADIGNATAVSEAAARAEYIFNLAGQISHVDSMEDPIADLDLNTRSHLAFLELLRRVNPDAPVVYASTRQVYGRPQYLPVDEEHPVRAADVNGISKYAAEQFHLLYSRAFSMRTCALRITNVYGPRQRLLGDHQAFMAVFLRHALENQAITVYGEGKQERDLLHVDDVVNAFLLAVRCDEARDEVFNLSHDEACTVRQVAETIVAAAASGSVESMPWPPERARIDIGSYRGTSAKAKRVLGWSPRIGFQEGIAGTVAYYKPRLDWYL
ncbi:MAG: NAD-dependent epimerase/dehydratase family protein [Acidimicrobiales bacterium]